MVKHKEIGIMILAAGSSSRLGQPKQLFKINGETLIEKTIKSALATSCHPIVVILGAHSEIIKPLVENQFVQVLINENWESGMGSSISCGMDLLINNYPQLKAVILLVCDQYYLSEKNITDLISIYKKENKNMVASKYAATIGVPALFAKNKFTELLQLTGHQGAKKIISQNSEDVVLIDFPEGVFDLDTTKDLDRLNHFF